VSPQIDFGYRSQRRGCGGDPAGATLKDRYIGRGRIIRIAERNGRQSLWQITASVLSSRDSNVGKKHKGGTGTTNSVIRKPWLNGAQTLRGNRSRKLLTEEKPGRANNLNGRVVWEGLGVGCLHRGDVNEPRSKEMGRRIFW